MVFFYAILSGAKEQGFVSAEPAWFEELIQFLSLSMVNSSSTTASLVMFLQANGSEYSSSLPSSQRRPLQVSVGCFSFAGPHLLFSLLLHVLQLGYVDRFEGSLS